MKKVLKRFVPVAMAGLVGLFTHEAIAAPQFREETVIIKGDSGFFAPKIETQIYSPPVDGVFPIVVINHGHEGVISARDMRELYRGQALEFVRRGYVVVVPYRSGYSHSSGNSTTNNICSTDTLGKLWAEDVIIAINYAKQLANVDPTKIVSIGQSQGGFTTAALGALNVPGVVGIINIVGAAREPNCPSGYGPPTDAYGVFGKTSRVPALFMYGDNDMYGSAAGPDSVPRGYVKAYNNAGGQATLYDYGVYGRDSHTMFHRKSALAIWEPPVSNFFQSLGLSWDVKYQIVDPQAWSRKGAIEEAANGNEIVTDK